MSYNARAAPSGSANGYGQSGGTASSNGYGGRGDNRGGRARGGGGSRGGNRGGNGGGRGRGAWGATGNQTGQYGQSSGNPGPRYQPYPAQQQGFHQQQYQQQSFQQPFHQQHHPSYLRSTQQYAYSYVQPTPDPYAGYAPSQDPAEPVPAVEMSTQELVAAQQRLLAEQHQRNLALLPAAVAAMAAHFGPGYPPLQQLQQQFHEQQQQQQQQQNFMQTPYAPYQYQQHQPSHVGKKHPQPPQPPQQLLENLHCVTCDKRFSHITQYTAHCATHVTCAHCSFESALKVVRVHELTEHPNLPSEGRPILTFTPEEEAENAAWIAERKKRYPTEANLAAKAQADQSRSDAGGVLHERKGLGKKSRNTTRRLVKPAEPPSIEDGLGMLKGYASSGDDDDDDDEDSDSSLSSSSNEGPDSDEADEEGGTGNGVPPVPRQKEQVAQKPKQQCRWFMRGRCIRGDRCWYAHDPAFVRERIKQPSIKAQQSMERAEQKHNRRSLLKMLLETDMRKEKNTILQCIRHLVQKGLLVAPAAVAAVAPTAKQPLTPLPSPSPSSFQAD